MVCLMIVFGFMVNLVEKVEFNDKCDEIGWKLLIKWCSRGES